MYLFIPQWWFPAYPIIPATFLTVGIVEILLIAKSKTLSAKLYNNILIQRIIRWGILLAVLLLMIGVYHPPKVAFIISFMGLFLVYSFLSIWFHLVDIKANRKKEQIAG
jgi:uncharacterized membrane protein YiaA